MCGFRCSGGILRGGGPAICSLSLPPLKASSVSLACSSLTGIDLQSPSLPTAEEYSLVRLRDKCQFRSGYFPRCFSGSSPLIPHPNFFIRILKAAEHDKAAIFANQPRHLLTDARKLVWREKKQGGAQKSERRGTRPAGAVLSLGQVFRVGYLDAGQFVSSREARASRMLAYAFNSAVSTPTEA